jgi:hypothetical protein
MRTIFSPIKSGAVKGRRRFVCLAPGLSLHLGDALHLGVVDFVVAVNVLHVVELFQKVDEL